MQDTGTHRNDMNSMHCLLKYFAICQCLADHTIPRDALMMTRIANHKCGVTLLHCFPEDRTELSRSPHVKASAFELPSLRGMHTVTPRPIQILARSLTRAEHGRRPKSLLKRKTSPCLHSLLISCGCGHWPRPSCEGRRLLTPTTSAKVVLCLEHPSLRGGPGTPGRRCESCRRHCS